MDWFLPTCTNSLLCEATSIFTNIPVGLDYSTLAQYQCGAGDKCLFVKTARHFMMTIVDSNFTADTNMAFTVQPVFRHLEVHALNAGRRYIPDHG